jgi:hypothetical protein
MKLNLEDFIRSNREAFDHKEPSEKVWSRIHNELFASQRGNTALLFWRAAAILFMGLSAYLLYPRVSEKKDNQLVMNEFKNVESFYAQEISSKMDMIESYPGSEKGLNGYTHDFSQLEAMYEVLKEEMKVRPSKKVKDALILNLLVRIDLLNKQLEKLETTNDESQVRGAKVPAVST